MNKMKLEINNYWTMFDKHNKFISLFSCYFDLSTSKGIDSLFELIIFNFSLSIFWSNK